VTPKDPNVSGWRPDFRPADEQIERNSARLHSLIGRRIIEAWTVWIVDEDWFADIPVVIRFDDGTQLEVCWEKFDDLSITWNTIDVESTPRAWVDRALEWRRNAHLELSSVVGGTVTDVRATKFLFTTENVVDPTDVGTVWLTTGIWLETDRGDLQVFNALDENGLSADPAERDVAHDWTSISASTDSV